MSQIVVSPRDLLNASRPKTQRGTYYIQTWGCQMNEEDSEQMGLYLETIGFEKADNITQAHVILLNTCSVRRKPEDKAFSLLGEIEPLRWAKPDVIIGVCGCMAQARADEIRRRAPHVDFVLGTGDIGQLPALVEEVAQKRRFQKRIELPERKGNVVEDVPQRHLGRTPKLKAFVPIQYGCDKFCTFCIVPTTRGRERSRPTLDILDEVATLTTGGTKEVTLLGQTVNSYGKNLLEGRVPFSSLLWQLNDLPGLERIRYTSPYPRDFRADLIDTIRDCPKVMEHVHLPMQSGDDAMLKEMHRLYTVESYLEIVQKLRKQIPAIGLTTDIIVGFPGETEEQFANTLSIMEKVRFDGAFMFAYSIRPGTPAGDRIDQVPEKVKKERLARLIALQNTITCEINEAYVGRTLEVLIEGPSPKNPKILQGYSREFKMVHFEGPIERIGRVAEVRVTGSQLWGLRGELA
ncbi:MAG: tRNA (N6-isopentenyl adenosine(37)-C2)-methylthiotransferase MiaB [Fimbriimonas sp.]|nr:tRNA (N6-isopentenyl adenosine(37)-C2)-methylthiotransferase MiaB [Fimbriimonas sp.]